MPNVCPRTSAVAVGGLVARPHSKLRVFVVTLGPTYSADWRPMVYALAVLSLLVGSLLAVVQTNVKRMLAFSSISHAGFILVGVEAALHSRGPGAEGVSSSLLYLMVYAVLVTGTFGVVTAVSRTGDASTDLAGAYQVLASDASAFITGTVVSIDGGYLLV